jgi:3D (Asp-Asp-Asp) domain-containing protein
MRGLTYLLAIVVTLNCSAYADRGITASGEQVQDGICAVDRINGVLIPFGTKITLPDGTTLVVKDRICGGQYNNHLDRWIENEDKCWEFGRKNLRCEVEIP